MKASSPSESSPDPSATSVQSGLRGNFSRWTIRRRVGVAIALILALVGVQSWISLARLQGMNRQITSLTEDTLPGLLAISQIQRNAGEVQINVLRLLLPNTPEQHKRYRETIEKLRLENTALCEQYEKTVFDEANRVVFAKVIETREDYGKKRAEMLQLLEDGKEAEARTFNTAELRPAFDRFQQALDGTLAYDVSNGKNLGTLVSRAARQTFIVIASAAGAVFVIGGLLGFVIIAGLSRVLGRVANTLEQGSDEVAAAAGQVSGASQTMAQGANEQAASLEETSSSLEELASMTGRNSDSAAKANALARDTRIAADRGAADMQEMNAAMREIKQSSDDVAKIVKTIDEIAFQTNILALNAAVEAARAGTAGAGFAVVADEVRALAQRSALAAKETAEKIESAITRTSQGVQISDRVTTSLTQIVEKVRQVDQLMAEVSTASGEQNQGVAQINTAVTQMDKIVQSSASNAEETAAAAEELSAQAVAMRAAVRELLELVNGSRRSQAAPQSTHAHTTRIHVHENNSAVNGKKVRPERIALHRDSGEPALRSINSFRDVN